jgi:hypothetical protein
MRIVFFLIGAVGIAACKRDAPPAPSPSEQAAPPLPAAAPAGTPAKPRLADLRVVLASEATLRELGQTGAEIVRRPWVGPLFQVLAEDAPESPRHLPQKRAAELSADLDSLFAQGLGNLRKATPQPISERTIEVAKSRVRATQSADNYTAARLLLPDLWSKIAAENGGRLYAAAPVRDMILWTTSPAQDDQSKLRKQARIAFQSRSFQISPAILRWTGHGWALEDANPVHAE